MSRALRATEGFKSWSDQLLDQLLTASHLQQFKKAEAVTVDLYGLKSNIFIVSGYVFVEQIRSGSYRLPIGMAGPGSLLGFQQKINPQFSIPIGIRAHTDVVAINILSGSLLKLLEQEPVLWRDIARMQIRHHNLDVELLAALSINHFRTRIAIAADRLAEIIGITDTLDENKITIPISQKEFSELLRASRPALNKALRSFEAKGILAVKYGSLQILDRRNLIQFSDIQEALLRQQPSETDMSHTND